MTFVSSELCSEDSAPRLFRLLKDANIAVGTVSIQPFTSCRVKTQHLERRAASRILEYRCSA